MPPVNYYIYIRAYLMELITLISCASEGVCARAELSRSCERLEDATRQRAFAFVALSHCPHCRGPFFSTRNVDSLLIPPSSPAVPLGQRSQPHFTVFFSFQFT